MLRAGHMHGLQLPVQARRRAGADLEPAAQRGGVLVEDRHAVMSLQ